MLARDRSIWGVNDPLHDIICRLRGRNSTAFCRRLEPTHWLASEPAGPALPEGPTVLLWRRPRSRSVKIKKRVRIEDHQAILRQGIARAEPTFGLEGIEGLDVAT